MQMLTTDRLILRNWRDSDWPLFHLINSNDEVMRFFPFRRDRAASDALMQRLAAGIARDGFGFAAIELRDSGQTAGFAGLHRSEGLPALPPGSIEIGWRLAPEFWHRGIASEAARAWLACGFETLGLQRIVSFAVADNVASLAVMHRIGMRRRPDLDFDHPGVPASHPHLRHHAFCEITAAQWAKQNDG
ncbi:GNAT family N-acetyltransferase [Pseudohoeflea coraliihabitans]|uniref:GNAT family N-acetyltransferase n=1 Tax=Pseudohoeflea coraliihabitans TaxID=2860393 RepID=A0ABS6WL81_9HYPH|nr:GNAT family N-acetyltransferase [Pseudohoeflea sp. DP4N28-3]MBW3095880.1 GNAT family N-acetyltransferase [Pseudohoeflea sp. DP4N28-3]